VVKATDFMRNRYNTKHFYLGGERQADNVDTQCMSTVVSQVLKALM